MKKQTHLSQETTAHLHENKGLSPFTLTQIFHKAGDAIIIFEPLYLHTRFEKNSHTV